MEDRFERVEIASREELRQWLQENHLQSESIWLVISKKSVANRYVPYDAIVEEALCFGWVDSRVAKLDAERSMLLLSPRRAGSRWSRPNKERIARLTEQGQMHPLGIAAVERARADGTWDALDEVEDCMEPEDLASALTGISRANWEAFPRSIRRGTLEWLLSAKTAATRRKRIESIVRLAAAGIRPLTPAAREFLKDG